MIETVAFEKTTYAPLPNWFEAGTPDIAGAVGLAAAIGYVQQIGFNEISSYEDALLRYATERLQGIPGLKIFGLGDHKAAVISFVLEEPPVAPLDIATNSWNGSAPPPPPSARRWSISTPNSGTSAPTWRN